MLVPDRAVTANTGNIFDRFALMRNGDRFDHRLVTAATGLLGDLAVPFADLYRFVKAAEGKIIRMPESVGGFGCVFSEEIVGRVTVVAGRGRVMTRFEPAVVLLIHDVAVGAGRRVVRAGGRCR